MVNAYVRRPMAVNEVDAEVIEANSRVVVVDGRATVE